MWMRSSAPVHWALRVLNEYSLFPQQALCEVRYVCEHLQDGTRFLDGLCIMRWLVQDVPCRHYTISHLALNSRMFTFYNKIPRRISSPKCIPFPTILYNIICIQDIETAPSLLLCRPASSLNQHENALTLLCSSSTPGLISHYLVYFNTYIILKMLHIKQVFTDFFRVILLFLGTHRWNK